MVPARPINPFLRPTTLRLVPQASGPSAWLAWKAWSFDISCTSSVAFGLYFAWTEFLSVFVFPIVGYQAEKVFLSSMLFLPLLATPLVHFALTFVCLYLGRRTAGMRYYGYTLDELDTRQALEWSYASTVSMAVLGLPHLWRRQGQDLVDRFAGTTASMSNVAAVPALAQDAPAPAEITNIAA
jgi:hypothetical protein